MINRIHPIFRALADGAPLASDGPVRPVEAMQPLADQHDDITSGWRTRRSVPSEDARDPGEETGSR